MADQRKGKIPVLGIILAILIVVILFLVIVIIIVGRHPGEPESHLTELDIRNSVYSIYKSEGVDKVQEFYDNLEKDIRNTDEKKAFLGNKIKNLYAACGWGCSDQILASVHQLYELDNQSTELYDLCYYEEFYVDDNPIAPCIQEGEYDGEG